MDETLANRLFDAAIYIAHAAVTNPSDELVLSLFEWLVHTYKTSNQPVH